MSTPARRSAAKDVLIELAAVAAELVLTDSRRDALAARRDELILEARSATPPPSQRDVAEIAGVTHPWVRRLEARRSAS